MYSNKSYITYPVIAWAKMVPANMVKSVWFQTFNGRGDRTFLVDGNVV